MLAESMYSGNQYITSQLISSYAWDTALNYICQTNEEEYLLATTNDSAYGNINTGGTDSVTLTGEYKVNGETSDKYSNIYDFLGNCLEFTTEYSSNSDEVYTRPSVYRGGCVCYEDATACFRGCIPNFDGSYYYSFRLQLYINPES